MAKQKLKSLKLTWVQSREDKDKWVTTSIPPGEMMAGVIKKSSKNKDESYTFYVYRDGQYLDCTNDLEEAKKVGNSGAMRPERVAANDAVRKYLKETPKDIDAFKKLPKASQQAIRDVHPHLAPRSSTLDLDRTGKGGGITSARRDLVSSSEKKAIGLPMESKIERKKPGNPKKEGSDAHMRWELLFQCVGKTVADFIAAKGNPTTLKNAVKAGYIKVEGL